MNNKQRKTLESIFADPVSASISWSDIESVFRADGGNIKEGRGSRIWFIWETQVAVFHRPHPQPTTDKGGAYILQTIFFKYRIEAMSTMTYKGYQGKFEYDQDADIFHGEVFHLNDVVTFQGRSIDELKKALADSVEDYLLLCKEVGKEPEKPFSGRFNIRISPELHQQIAAKAADAGMSLNSLIMHQLQS